MEMLTNFKFVQDIAKQLIQPRPCIYFALDISKHINNRELFHYQNQHFQIPDERNISLHMIQNTVFKNVQNPIPSTCIVYLHGLSSFSVEGTFLVQNLQKHFTDLNVSVCLYDLRGHGKDKGQNITFGLKQSKQLYQILLHLKKQRNYKQFILWGRSMGATTILKMVNDFHQQLQQNQIIIKYMVLDSAFLSIQKVATQIISKKSGMPQIFCKPVFEYLISTVEKLHNIRLKVDISVLHNAEIKALFLYSEIDKMVNAEHSKILYNKYPGPKDKIEINVDHNEQRPESVLNSVFQKLRQCLKMEPILQRRKSLTIKKTGLSVTKIQRVKTHQSVLDEAENCPTQNFYHLKTQESNKENLKDEQNKTSRQKISQSPMYTEDAKNLKNKNAIKMSPKPFKIAKENHIKELKLTKKYISLNGNIKHSPKLFQETQINVNQLKSSEHKKQQKLKLSHKNLIDDENVHTYQLESRHKTSIYEKATQNKSQQKQKQPQTYAQNVDYSRFRQVKSTFLIRYQLRPVSSTGENMKQSYMKKKYNQNELIHKKLLINQASHEKSSVCCNWTTNHIAYPTKKPQSENITKLIQKPQSENMTKLIQKKVSNTQVANSFQKDFKSQLRLGDRKNIRKNIDQQLLRLDIPQPVYQSCIISSQITPKKTSQKVIFNFQSSEQSKTAAIQHLSNEYYL